MMEGLVVQIPTPAVHNDGLLETSVGLISISTDSDNGAFWISLILRYYFGVVRLNSADFFSLLSENLDQL